MVAQHPSNYPTKLPDGTATTVPKGQVGVAPGAPAAAGAGGSVDTSAIDTAMNELQKKYSDTSTEVGSVNTTLKEFLQKFLH